MNAKFLNEAVQLAEKWQQMPWAQRAFLMESVRLRNEYQTDEEYAVYLNGLETRWQQILKIDRMC
jgi:hypothetical protein